jgi:hypothetical protein
MHAYSILQAIDVFLDVRHSSFNAAGFLTNASRVWESMVLRTGKERATLQIYVLL